MKVISTNIAQPVTFNWDGEEVTTGIYKKPTGEPIYLTKNIVSEDEISDRLNHGGYYKACYIFSAEQYPRWKALYPDLDWNWGMFGENLTVEGFDESRIFLGDVYKLGEALVQVSQHRDPCYKFGHKFGSQKVLKQFIEHGFGGTYLSLLEEGAVQVGDDFKLVDRPKDLLTVKDLFQLVYAEKKDQTHLRIASESRAIGHSKREKLKTFIEKV